MSTYNHDLTNRMAPYLDVHMISPVLDYLREIELYDATKITAEKIRAVERTNMIELVEDEYARVASDPVLSAEFAKKNAPLSTRKAEILNLLDNNPAAVTRVSAFFNNVELVAQLRSNSNFTLPYVSEHHSISADDLEQFAKFAKFKYECGMYSEAEEMLTQYLSLAVGGAGSMYSSALWGKLACRIVMGKFEDSLSDLHAVKESVEVRNANPSDQLRQRAWLMHWSLLVHLNQRHGMEALVDLFSERYYLQTLENLCPWLLRYYAFAMILSPIKRKTALKDVLNEISSLSYLYSDPLTQFLDSLFDAFDFDIAQVKLQECVQLVRNDFFLQAHADKFIHEARMLITEMYCTVHHSVDLTVMAEKLHLSEEEAEKWMVNVVRGSASAVNAKIDSFGKQVLIAPPQQQAHKHVVEITKELTQRTGVLNHNLVELAKEQANYIFRR